jgi:lysozyme family protein
MMLLSNSVNSLQNSWRSGNIRQKYIRVPALLRKKPEVDELINYIIDYRKKRKQINVPWYAIYFIGTL